MNKQQFCKKYEISEENINLDKLVVLVLKLFGSIKLNKFNAVSLDGVDYPEHYSCGFQDNWGYCDYSLDVMSSILKTIDENTEKDTRFKQLIKELQDVR